MKQITVGDININYEIQCSGVPLLMIMGLSFSLRDWGKKFTELLAQHYQLILFDNRDAGLTSKSTRPYNIADMVDDAAGLLDALNIPKVHVFGVSMGGAIAQQFALKYPDKLDKLILGCTIAGGNCSQPGDISGVMSGNLLDVLFTPTFIQNHQQELAELFTKTTPFHSQESALQRQLQAFATHDTCDTLSDIKAPTLVITGDKDMTIPPSNSNLLAAKIPNAKLEIIADAAHGFSYSHPEIATNLIHLFLQQPSHLETMIMKDQLKEILNTFVAYIQAFNLLEPTKVLPFFHLPAMLITSTEVAVMEKPIEVLGVFAILMDDLKHKNFKESKIIGSLEVKQLSENQGQVVGVAKRFDRSDAEIEHFGFTYTLRKIQVKDKDEIKEKWTIISGVLYEPETFSNAK
jgi:3-oxoadipate enol-lactonase